MQSIKLYVTLSLGKLGKLCNYRLTALPKAAKFFFPSRLDKLSSFGCRR